MTIIHCSCEKTYDDKYLFKHLNLKYYQKFVEYKWNKDDIMKKLYKKKNRNEKSFILLFNMKRNYIDYINIIDEMENIG